MLKASIVVVTLAFSQLAAAGGELYPTADCMQKLAHDVRLQALDRKVALGLGDETTPALLALDRRVTGEESAAVARWLQLRQECFGLGAAHRAAAHAGLPLLANRMFYAQQRLLGELWAGRISLGEFNRRRLELWQVERRQQAELLRSDS